MRSAAVKPVLPPNYFGHGYAFRRRPLNAALFRLALAVGAGIALGLAERAFG